MTYKRASFLTVVLISIAYIWACNPETKPPGVSTSAIVIGGVEVTEEPADSACSVITPVNGTATVTRVSWLQSLDMSGPLVLDIVAGDSNTVSQVNLIVNAGTNLLTYSDHATNTVTGLSTITATNITSILFYSPMFTPVWEASEL